MKIAAHCLVKNEARFVWYSVMSVIEYVDRVLIWDDGSTDETVRIIREIEEKYPTKISFKELRNASTPKSYPKLRQGMLDGTKEDWFIVLDADEIWWDESIKKVIKVIKSSGDRELESIVVPTVNLVGDIYHFQEEAAGRYNLAGRTGHFNLRGVNRNILGLSSRNPHGTWGWTDGKGRMIQDRDQTRIQFIDAPYMHATFLQRSGERDGDSKVPKRAKKLKHEIGIEFQRDYYYPEVFFRPRPEFVESPWEVMSRSFCARALIETPLRKMKRKIMPAKVGY